VGRHYYRASPHNKKSGQNHSVVVTCAWAGENIVLRLGLAVGVNANCQGFVWHSTQRTARLRGGGKIIRVGGGEVGGGGSVSSTQKKERKRRKEEKIPKKGKKKRGG